MTKQKTIILDGFSQQEIINFMRIVKNSMPDMKNAIFASTTPTSLEWKIKDLLAELAKEHAYMKKNSTENTRKENPHAK